MPVALVFAALLLGATQHRPSNREAFAKAIAKVQDGWTKPQVAQLLGSPDSTWSIGDEEQWFYGTSPDNPFPTLGTVTFNGEQTWTFGGTGDPPPSKLISEQDLVSALRWLNKDNPKVRRYRGAVNSLRMVRAANFLIALGQAKALAILTEDARLDPDIDLHQWLFWLVRVAFTSKPPGGVFPIPAIGKPNPFPPKDLKQWPTYPVLLLDDVPVYCIRGVLLRGAAEPFSWYLKHHKSEWTLKRNFVVPADDPFKVYENIQGTAVAQLPEGDNSSVYPSRVGRDFKKSALEALLTLVSTVYKPIEPSEDGKYYVDGLDYDQCHREFLALHAHWDPKTQSYVRQKSQC